MPICLVAACASSVECFAFVTQPVRPVSKSDVEAACELLSPVVADMVSLQLACGCRPGEVCNMTPGEIDRAKEVWLYRPVQHKNTHGGHDRVIALSPRPQAILTKYLLPRKPSISRR